MNKYIYSLITFFTILFCGCDENKQEFTLVGKIQGLNSDTIIAYYQTPDFKLDTIVAINEEFKYTFTPDTFTIFTLFLKNGNELPIFADKGQSVEIKGTIDDPIIKGTSENKLLAQRRTQIYAIRLEFFRSCRTAYYGRSRDRYCTRPS